MTQDITFLDILIGTIVLAVGGSLFGLLVLAVFSIALATVSWAI